MKMLTCNKKYFNMVEIVLALAVVSIAIVSLMGVLPVALRASKNSVSDNAVASISAMMKMYMDNTYQTVSSLNDLYNGSNAPFNELSNFGTGNQRYEQNFLAPAGVLALRNEEAVFSGRYPSGAARPSLEIYYDGSPAAADRGCFLVELYSGNNNQVTDFSALVQIWKESFNGQLYCYIPQSFQDSVPINNRMNSATGTGSNVTDSRVITLVMRISYPADASYENQEHRYYKFDYFPR